MPIAETDAFVIGSKPMGDQDKLVFLLSKERGIKKGIAPGANKYKNRFGSVFELFTKGHFIYNWKEGRHLITLSKGEIIKSYFNTVSDSKNIFYFYIIAEILQRAIPENQNNTRIFKLINSILNSKEQETEINYLLFYFLIWFLKIEGLMFKPDICYNCFEKGIKLAFVREDYRGVLCKNCKTNEQVTLLNNDILFINWIFRNSPKIKYKDINKIDLNKLINIFIKKIEIHNDFSLKSKYFLNLNF